MFELRAETGLHIRHLHHSVPGRVLFRDFSAHFPPGVSLLCGDEGTGKSTLLRWLAEQLPAGTAFWCDTPQDAWAERVCTDLLSEWLNPFVPSEEGRAKTATRVDAVATQLDLRPHLHKPFHMLSTGSRRKLGLLAALCSQAPVVLLDQPFAALDLASARQVCGLLGEMAAPKKAAGRAPQVLIVADYLPPEGVTLVATVDLDQHQHQH